MSYSIKSAAEIKAIVEATNKEVVSSTAEIESAIRMLAKPDHLHEMRCVRKRGEPLIGGYYCDWRKMAEDAHAIDSLQAQLPNRFGKPEFLGAQHGIFMTLNPVQGSRFALQGMSNAFKAIGTGEATSKEHIVRLHNFMVDCDPDRSPKDISSTHEEHWSAILLSMEVRGYLIDTMGFPISLLASSGNGGHNVWRVDLPVSQIHLIKGSLDALSARFSNDAVKIDVSVGNEDRVFPIYGTFKRKGAHQPDDMPFCKARPHRQSRILDVPDVMEPVPAELLQRVIDECKAVSKTTVEMPSVKPEPKAEAKPQPKEPGFDDIDIDDIKASIGEKPFILADDVCLGEILAAEGLLQRDTPKTKKLEDGTMYELWVLKKCPFEEHGDASFIVFEKSRTVHLQCFHETCKSKKPLPTVREAFVELGLQVPEKQRQDRKPVEDVSDEEAELRGGDGQRSHPVDARMPIEKVERYRAALLKKNITIISESDGDPYLFETLCPCCGLDGHFKLSRQTAAYECAGGKKTWKDGYLLHSRRRGELKLYSMADVLDQEDEEWLIEDHLNTDVFCEVYGPPGVTKTFMCFDMAMCVATGKPYLDKFPVTQGKVVYLYAEGFGGMKKRLRAWLHHYPDVDVDEAMKNIHLIKVPVDFTQDMPTDAFVDLIDAHNVDPTFIIIDTLNRNYGGDENSTADMSAFVRNVDSVRDRYKATTLVVHHTGKDASKQGRGNSALIGGLSIVICLEGADKVGKQFQSVVVSFDKVKEGAGDLCYKLVKTKVQYGPDEKRDNSLVLLMSDDEPVMAEPSKEEKKNIADIYDLDRVFNDVMPDAPETFSKSSLTEMMQARGNQIESLKGIGSGKHYHMTRGKVAKLLDKLVAYNLCECANSEVKNKNNYIYRKIRQGRVDFGMEFGQAK